ncbi:MAG: methyltransferase [Proteobacteria bacterium]|nr:methyltransferase [Pseudomonadota bacterium]
MNKTLLVLAAFALAACRQAPDTPDVAAAAPAEPAAAEAAPDPLAAVLDAQPDEVRARYAYRHPQETLEFFGIEPGMTVLEGLPGRGWYTRLLLPYLGGDGHLIGVAYSLDMYPLFSFATEEFLAKQAAWAAEFPADAAGWAGEDGASATAFHFGALPAELEGTVDVVFFPRVLHNLARFSNETETDYLGAALADAYAALRPGGTFGVVQHHARDEMSEDFADGSHGYLKKAFVVAAVEAAGFEFVAESDINANPKDRPSEDDIVWRLPPSLATSRENPDLRAEFEAIGESNRMTLRFRKPDGA